MKKNFTPIDVGGTTVYDLSCTNTERNELMKAKRLIAAAAIACGLGAGALGIGRGIR